MKEELLLLLGVDEGWLGWGLRGLFGKQHCYIGKEICVDDKGDE